MSLSPMAQTKCTKYGKKNIENKLFMGGTPDACRLYERRTDGSQRPARRQVSAGDSFGDDERGEQQRAVER